MAKYTVSMMVTERTRQEIEVEASCSQEALDIVENYDFDNSLTVEMESLEWSVSDIIIVD